MLRAVVVDDSPTVRSLLRRILEGDGEIEVAGEARDGVEAVALVQSLRPDVVTMDIHMPRMDGLEATREIMIAAPTPIVVVTSSARAGDVTGAMSALEAGALTVLRKPSGPDSPDFEAVSRTLVSTVKTMAAVKVVRRHRRSAPVAAASTALRGGGAVKVVAIATSTGGPQALARLLGDLPEDFAAPVLVVQHIGAGFTAGLASWLSSCVPLRVKVAEAGEPLVPATVYIAPEDQHLGVALGRRVALSSDPPLGGFRPSGTHLFQSVAAAYGPAAAALILTGMGEDGLEGLRAVHRAGGRVIAQDEASSVVFGMPAAAIRAGLADRVLPLERIAREVLSLVGQ